MNSKYENTDMKMQPKKQRNLTRFFNLLSIAGLAGCALLAIWAYKKRHFKFGRFFADIYLEIRLYWNARFYSDPGCAGYYSNPTGWSQLPGWCDLFLGRG